MDPVDAINEYSSVAGSRLAQESLEPQLSYSDFGGLVGKFKRGCNGMLLSVSIYRFSLALFRFVKCANAIHMAPYIYIYGCRPSLAVHVHRGGASKSNSYSM